ncbi:hypothetical protein EMCRGX_G034529 [Ephydatia muelleri]
MALRATVARNQLLYRIARVRLYTTTQLSSVTAFSFSLLSRLGKKLADGKGGLGCEGDPQAISRAREALLLSLGPQIERMQPEAIAACVCTHYKKLESEEKKHFLGLLAGDLGVKHEEVHNNAQRLLDTFTQQRDEPTLLKSELTLRQSLQPFYWTLFTYIARLEGGLKFLLDMREDLLTTLSVPSEGMQYNLSSLNTHLKEILAQWFSVEFLQLHNITWRTPCDIMEKVSQYEAVHPVRSWKDLKYRVGLNRRCFVFIHPAMPREPLVVLHTALTEEPSDNIQALINRSQHKEIAEVNAAVFYSIFTTQPGLSGVHLGNFLIKRVVKELQKEFPSLKQFVTLSPIPGFRKWLESFLKQQRGGLVGVAGFDPTVYKTQMQSYASSLTRGAEPSRQLEDAIKAPLMSLCARYLAMEKRRGYVLDPVAHFHLTNGASLWRLNWAGDVSKNGLERSYGLMVNYRYDLPDISENSLQYTLNGTVAMSSSVQKLLPGQQAPPSVM